MLTAETINTHCCGVLVINGTKTILVKTHKNNYSYPKGKKEKGETNMETALRELEEETGLLSNDIEFYPNTYFIERKDENKPVSVLYYLAKLKNLSKELVAKDLEEVKEIITIDLNNIVLLPDTSIKHRRKEIALEALKVIYNVLVPSDEKYFSKSLSWILRHGVIKEHLNMDNKGYVPVEQIMRKQQFKNYGFGHLLYVVKQNGKQRFDMFNVNDIWFVRARQGHSEEVGAMLDDNEMLNLIEEPYDLCVHGTNKKAIKEIKNSGLKSMSRKHIHLSPEIRLVRATSTVLIKIDMALAMENGIKFYKSDNDVILCKQDIPVEYFKEIVYL